MNKAIYLTLIIVFIVSFLGLLGQNKIKNKTEGDTFPKNQKIIKSNEQWKKELDPNIYFVTREAGTERAFTGKYWDNKKSGIYNCSNCNLSLFSSETKFNSGTGWPSFYDKINGGHVYEKTDASNGWTRVEILCGRCDAHLGHVFDDGPAPTGLRYCVNSASLNFEAK